ncbi:MAG: fused MFS/spermidine synthase, partial [Polyangiaceae bacterium]
VALLGIGLGGLLYTPFGRDRPFGFDAFAITCALEALFLTVPWALGDRVALFALFLRPLGTTGFVGYLLSWTLVTFLVVLPAAMVAGFQFPLLIGLLGRAKRSVGINEALDYAILTLGSILGSLAGGFWLLPALSAPGAWKLCVVVLVVLGVAALGVHRRASGRAAPATPALLMVLTLLLVFGTVGPTAFWRHTPIGAGRADSFYSKGTKNDLKWHSGERRRAVTWEQDGRESAVALYTLNDTSFLVNGKSDGAAVTDAGTQVMGGLLGALLQPEPVKAAMVIGLGTGSTAGWLGALPDIERVDVVELEPAILHVADVCAPVNRDVLDNPKVAITIADAREVLLTTPRRYDLVFSEPSNPYRAGIASLFTQEFYEAVRDRLTPGGVFLQWVQGYEIDAQSIRIVYATLSSVFGSIETWRTKSADLILVARMEPVPL